MLILGRFYFIKLFFNLASLREVTLRTIALNNRFNIVPGQKICTNCLVKLKACTKINTDNIDISDDYTNESINKENVFNVQPEADINKNRQELSDCFSIIGVSSVKLHRKPFANCMSIGEKKVKNITTVFKEKLSSSLKIPLTEVEVFDNEYILDLKKKVVQFEKMLVLIKNKLEKCCSLRDKIQILTLCPQEWSIEVASEYFGVSKYLIIKSRSLAKKEGVLAVPQTKRGKMLPDQINTLVKNFYEDDENSRQVKRIL